MKLFIKNMISSSSRIFIESELIRLGIKYSSIKNGVIEIDYEISDQQVAELKKALHKYSLELTKKELPINGILKDSASE